MCVTITARIAKHTEPALSRPVDLREVCVDKNTTRHRWILNAGLCPIQNRLGPLPISRPEFIDRGIIARRVFLPATLLVHAKLVVLPLCQATHFVPAFSSIDASTDFIFNRGNVSKTRGTNKHQAYQIRRLRYGIGTSWNFQSALLLSEIGKMWLIIFLPMILKYKCRVNL